MQNVKNEIEKYLNNEINLSELNTFFRKNVPFSPNSIIEDIRLDADLTVEGELTQQQKEDELICEDELKTKLKEYLLSKIFF